MIDFYRRSVENLHESNKKNRLSHEKLRNSKDSNMKKSIVVGEENFRNQIDQYNFFMQNVNNKA